MKEDEINPYAGPKAATKLLFNSHLVFGLRNWPVTRPYLVRQAKLQQNGRVAKLYNLVLCCLVYAIRMHLKFYLRLG